MKKRTKVITSILAVSSLGSGVVIATAAQACQQNNTENIPPTTIPEIVQNVNVLTRYNVDTSINLPIFTREIIIALNSFVNNLGNNNQNNPIQTMVFNAISENNVLNTGSRLVINIPSFNATTLDDSVVTGEALIIVESVNQQFVVLADGVGGLELISIREFVAQGLNDVLDSFVNGTDDAVLPIVSAFLDAANNTTAAIPEQQAILTNGTFDRVMDNSFSFSAITSDNVVPSSTSSNTYTISLGNISFTAQSSRYTDYRIAFSGQNAVFTTQLDPTRFVISGVSDLSANLTQTNTTAITETDVLDLFDTFQNVLNVSDLFTRDVPGSALFRTNLDEFGNAPFATITATSFINAVTRYVPVFNDFTSGGINNNLLSTLLLNPNAFSDQGALAFSYDQNSRSGSVTFRPSIFISAAGTDIWNAAPNDRYLFVYPITLNYNVSISQNNSTPVLIFEATTLEENIVFFVNHLQSYIGGDGVDMFVLELLTAISQNVFNSVIALNFAPITVDDITITSNPNNTITYAVAVNGVTGSTDAPTNFAGDMVVDVIKAAGVLGVNRFNGVTGLSIV